MSQGKETGQEENEKDDGVWTDLMGDELVMKVYKDAKGGKTADMGDYVSIEVSGYVLEGDFKDDKDAAVREALEGGKMFLDKQNWSLTMGDSDVTPSLEMGSKFLCEGGKAYVLSLSKFAYGAAGRLGTKPCVSVGASQNVLFDISVISVVPCSSDQFDTKEYQIKRAASKKMLANDCYATEWDGMGRTRALKLYAKAADMMSYLLSSLPDPVPDDLQDTQKQAQVIVIDCLNNVAAVHLRSKDYGKAKQACAQVIQLDQQNIKALCRAAHAAMRDPASSYEESDLAISAAEEVLEKLSPKDHPKSFIEVRRLRADLAKRKRHYKQQQKEMSKKMFKKQEDEDQKMAEECLKVAKEAQEAKKEEDQSTFTRYWNAFLETQDIPRWKRFWRNFKIQIILMFLFSCWQRQKITSMRKAAGNSNDAPPHEMPINSDGETGLSEF